MQILACVVLPLSNREADAPSIVASVLESFEQLTAPMELLIFDNGSQDDTMSVALEFARRHPQIRVARTASRVGLGEIIERSWGLTASAWLCVHRGVGPISAGEILELLSISSCDAPLNELTFPKRLSSGFQLLRRATNSADAAAHRARQLALVERIDRPLSSRRVRRQFLCHEAAANLSLAK